MDRAPLFLIDSSKALRKPIRKLFGDWVLIGRCAVHKVRNVTEHLPQRVRGWVAAPMHKAYPSESVPVARRRLQNLVRTLEDQYSGAAGSLKEGLEETLTILGLGVGETFRRTLNSTNPIGESSGNIALGQRQREALEGRPNGASVCGDGNPGGPAGVPKGQGIPRHASVDPGLGSSLSVRKTFRKHGVEGTMFTVKVQR